MEDLEGHKEGGEVAPALVVVHPLEHSVAVSVGSDLRVYDLEKGHAVALTDLEGPPHSDSIRAICFGAKGTLFASAGDDKLVKIWKVESWQCICTVYSEKRVSAVAISHDGYFVCFADKFGVVWVISLLVEADPCAPLEKKPSPLLGHYCSIITSLEFAPDGQFIASADRDYKIRISAFPKRPLTGAHQIQSFCHGHTGFVSCLVFAQPPNNQAFLLSGGGDSTVRLWDFLSGSALDACEVGEKLSRNGSDSGGEEDCLVITNLCILHDCSVIAAAIQSFHGVVLLSCNFSAKKLNVSRVLSLEKFLPTSLGMSTNSNRLWMVMGASSLPSSDTGESLVRVKVADIQKVDLLESDAHDVVVLEDYNVPGGTELLEKLQGGLSAVNAVESSATAEALKTAMRNLLIKKQYPVEKREIRKKSRNDKKLKQ